MADGGRFVLSNLKHVLEMRKNSKGEDVECIVLPITANGIYKSEKGSVSVSFFFNTLHENFVKKLRENGGTETHKMVMRESEETQRARKAFNEANPDSKRYPAELGMCTWSNEKKSFEAAPNVTNDIAASGSSAAIAAFDDAPPF